jgi:peroxiredoxin
LRLRLIGALALTLCAVALFAQQPGQNGPQIESPFLPIPAAATDALVFRSRLNDFEATDLAGRTWRSKDLSGRVVVVSIWSTWCLPCRQEHPALQQFYEETKSRSNIQVLTFSVDQDPQKARRYLDEHHLTFPVIVDWELEKRLFQQVGGIPQSWIIDREGRRSEPFKAWTFGRVLLEAEKLAYTIDQR